jgi:hypothetical protein
MAIALKSGFASRRLSLSLSRLVASCSHTHSIYIHFSLFMSSHERVTAVGVALRVSAINVSLLRTSFRRAIFKHLLWLIIVQFINLFHSPFLSLALVSVTHTHARYYLMHNGTERVTFKCS